MKSRVIKLYDYKEVELPEVVIVDGLREKMDEEIRHLCKKFKKVENVDSVKNGDIVMVDTKSALPKFNRTGLRLNVGKNFYDKEFEKNLVGLRVGEDADFKVGDTAVSVRVLESRRNVYPELSDEIVAEGMALEEYNEPDIKMVEQYLERLHDDASYVLIEARQNEEVKRLLDTVIAKSEWQYDEDEISSFVDEQLEITREELAAEGKNLDTMSGQEYRVMFSAWDCSVNNKEELRVMLTDLIKESFSTAIIACVINGKDYADIEFEDVEYTVWDIFTDYIKEKITFKIRED